MWTHNAGVASSIPSCVTIEMSLARKVMESHLIKSTSLENTQTPVSGFCYARNRVRNVLVLYAGVEDATALHCEQIKLNTTETQHSINNKN